MHKWRRYFLLSRRAWDPPECYIRADKGCSMPPIHPPIHLEQRLRRHVPPSRSHLQADVRSQSKRALANALHRQKPVAVRRHEILQHRLGAALRQDS